MLPFLTIQRQRCIKFRVLRAQDFYAPLALNFQKGQHLPALVVYKIREILVSVKFLSAILGLEMAAPILWTPGKNAFFLQEDLHVHKISRFGGVGVVGGGGGVPMFFFYGRGGFSDKNQSPKVLDSSAIWGH